MRKHEFAKRAVEQCVDAMVKGKLSAYHVSAVLKYEDVDISSIEPFLYHENDFIRHKAVQIFGKHKQLLPLLELAKVETDTTVLISILGFLSNRREGIEDLANLLNNKTKSIRAAAIEMYRKAGRGDCLVGLLFDDDDDFVEHIKKCIRDADEKEASRP